MGVDAPTLEDQAWAGNPVISYLLIGNGNPLEVGHGLISRPSLKYLNAFHY